MAEIILDHCGCTQRSFSLAGGVPILSGFAKLQDLRQFGVLEVKTRQKIANKQRWYGAWLLVDTVLRKQIDAAQTKHWQWPSQVARGCAFGAVLPSQHPGGTRSLSSTTNGAFSLVFVV